MAATVPRPRGIVWRDRRLTYADLARPLPPPGLVPLPPRARRSTPSASTLAGHESGQDHLGLYLYNGNEYLEGMIGAYMARVAPFNVNYRYVEEELRYLLTDARRAGPRSTTPPSPPCWPRSSPRSRTSSCSPGGRRVRQRSSSRGPSTTRRPWRRRHPSCRPSSPSPDDLYILYTGGTTGMPKGVLWRQHDIFRAAMGGRTYGTWELVESYEHLVGRVLPTDGVRVMSIPPLMHGAAQWACFYYMTMGGHPGLPRQHPHPSIPSTCGTPWPASASSGISVVGDAMARPLVEELERGGYDASARSWPSAAAAPR